MDWSGGPAVLGGIMMCVALGAWSLGRWQVSPGGLTAPREEPGTQASARTALRAPVALCEHAARAERDDAPPATDRLGELHEEISAYRRTEHVLAELRGDILALRTPRDSTRQVCRYLGIVGEPTCGVTDSARIGCACGTDGDHTAIVPAAHTLPPLRPLQPSAAGEGARV